MQKIFLRVQNISKSPEKFCEFFRVLAQSREVLKRQNCAEKTAPRLKGRLNRLTTLL
jgi:hypothetical protein